MDLKYFKLPAILFLVLVFSLSVSGQRKPIESDETKTTQVKVNWKDKGEMTTKNIIQDREMSKYYNGGYFDCRDGPVWVESRGTCDENKIRDFIWQHWTKRQRAYIRVTYNSVDAIGTSHIFIEPNKQGKWTVHWRIVRSSALPGSHDEITDVEKIVYVERVEDKPKMGEWALVFKNRFGTAIETMPDF
jgi:hypothetical protein